MMNLFSKAKDLFDCGKLEDWHLLDNERSGDLDYIKTVDPKVLLKARDENGNTVLMIATKNGDLNLCKEILKKCPSLLYHVNNFKRTVLHQATNPNNSSENFLFIDFFVSASLNEIATSNEGDIYMKFKRWMNMQDYKGDTALVEAARYGNLHVVQRFVEVDHRYNLSPSKAVQCDGINTALSWAVGNEDLEMSKLLTDEVDRYSDFVPYSTAIYLFNGARKGDLYYIKTVELNVLLNSRDQDRMSVLCIATKCNQFECCKEILKRCPSLLYHQNNDKWSVLHHAADHKNFRLIDFFVRAGVEAAKSDGGRKNMTRFKMWINLQTRTIGDTALILAVISRSHDIVKMFAQVDRQYKLKLSEIIGRDNKTALQWAMLSEDHEMIKTLFGSGVHNLDNDANTGVVSESNNITLAEVNKTVVSENNNIPLAEVWKHNNLKDSWLVINDKVYDVSTFLGVHPGGSEVLLKASGKDATTDFKKVHSHSIYAVSLMDKFYIGACDSITSSLTKLVNDKPQLYSRGLLKEFTKDFSLPIGSGGFGDIYKGQLPNGVFIAVKVLKNMKFKEKVM